MCPSLLSSTASQAIAFLLDRLRLPSARGPQVSGAYCLPVVSSSLGLPLWFLWALSLWSRLVGCLGVLRKSGIGSGFRPSVGSSKKSL